MIPWKWLLALDAVTMFIISTGGSITSMMVDGQTRSLPSWAGILVAVLGGFVAISQQLRARLAIPPPSAAMIAQAVAAVAPMAAKQAAEDAAPAVAAVAKKAAEDAATAAAPAAAAAAAPAAAAAEAAKTNGGTTP